MTFKFTVESKYLSAFVNSMAVVMNDGFIEVTKSGLIGRGLNASNTIFVDTTLPMNIDCEDHKLAVDISRMASVIPNNNETVSLSYGTSMITTKVGKSTYKFHTLSPSSVREIKTPKLEFNRFVIGISPIDFYNSIRAIEQYNKETERYYKCQVIWDGEALHIADNHGDVDTEIEVALPTTADDLTSFDPVTVNMSSDLLIDIATYMKKYASGINIGFIDNDQPIKIYTVGTFYMIAPRVEVD